MAKRPRAKNLSRWEVSLVKAMIASGQYNDQTTHAYFTRPSRSINQRVISEIRNGTKHAHIRPASTEDLRQFLSVWPQVDYETGASLLEDELLIKSREAMLAAVQTFNSGGLNFRSELFIVSAVIAWTYLLHSWYKKEGIDYWYKNADGTPRPIRRNGPVKYWELGYCLRRNDCPLPLPVRKNLEFIIEIRDEIEHRMTTNIDVSIGAKLQACCLNYNTAIMEYFGQQYGLEKRLPLALQFVTFNSDQRNALKSQRNLPAHISTMMQTFEDGLTNELRLDSSYAYRVLLVPKSANHLSGSDEAVELVREGSEDAENISRVLMKEVTKSRFPRDRIIELVRNAGFPRFSSHWHTQLVRQLDAKNVAHGFGTTGDYRNSWVWYQKWLDRVLAHCEEQGDRYR